MCSFLHLLKAVICCSLNTAPNHSIRQFVEMDFDIFQQMFCLGFVLTSAILCSIFAYIHSVAIINPLYSLKFFRLTNQSLPHDTWNRHTISYFNWIRYRVLVVCCMQIYYMSQRRHETKHLQNIQKRNLLVHVYISKILRLGAVFRLDNIAACKGRIRNQNVNDCSMMTRRVYWYHMPA